MLKLIFNSIVSITLKVLDIIHDLLLMLNELSVTAILTMLITIITVSILVLQYMLAKQRWRLDLYDKRLKTYIDVLHHLSNIVTFATLSNQENIEFLRKTREIDFLFKNDIQDFLQEIYTKGNDFILSGKLMENPSSEKQRLENIKKNGELMDWFAKQLDVNKELFKKYLSITKR